MESRTYASRLRYLDADDVDDSVVDVDGLDVRGTNGEKLGDVDGFIVDLASSRVLYVVVDSGGWFRSRRFLAPIGHAFIDQGRRALTLDIGKERLKQYPEFAEERFSEFSDADLREFEARMAEVCCPEEPAGAVAIGSELPWAYETRRHYRQPEWWTGGAYAHERLRPVESPAYRVSPGRRDREQSMDDEHDRPRTAAGADVRSRDLGPHPEGRAQPGDVLGIETAGERTYMGDTSEDENRRRLDAERSARLDEPRQSER
jgi:hypothetical protein